MTDTPTTRNQLRKQSIGSNINLWGAPNLNEAFDDIDESLDGQITIDCTAASPIILTNVPYTSGQQARYRFLILTGALTANKVIQCPSVQKWYVVINNTTGAFTVSLQTVAGGTLTTLVQGRRTIAYSNGTDTFSSELRLDQIDVPTSSVNLNGQLLLNAATAVSGTGVPNLTQVQGLIAALSLSNLGTLPTASINFNNQKGFNAADATVAQDLVNLRVMSSAIAAAGITSPGTVRVSVTDTTAAYLSEKIIGGAIRNQGANEQYVIPIDIFNITFGLQ